MDVGIGDLSSEDAKKKNTINSIIDYLKAPPNVSDNEPSTSQSRPNQNGGANRQPCPQTRHEVGVQTDDGEPQANGFQWRNVDGYISTSATSSIQGSPSIIQNTRDDVRNTFVQSTWNAYPGNTSYVHSSLDVGQETLSFAQSTSDVAQENTPFAQSTSNFAKGTTPFAESTSDITQGTTTFAESVSDTTQGITPYEQGTADVTQGTTTFAESISDTTQGITPYEQGTSDVTQGTTPFAQNKSNDAQETTSFGQNTSNDAQGTTSFAQNTSNVAQGTTSFAQNKSNDAKGTISFAQNTPDVTQGTTLYTQPTPTVAKGTTTYNCYQRKDNVPKPPVQNRPTSLDEDAQRYFDIYKLLGSETITSLGPVTDESFLNQDLLLPSFDKPTESFEAVMMDEHRGGEMTKNVIKYADTRGIIQPMVDECTETKGVKRVHEPNDSGEKMTSKKSRLEDQDTKRAKNREASKRCRVKKKMELEKLEKKAQCLRTQNKHLVSLKEQLYIKYNLKKGR